MLISDYIKRYLIPSTRLPINTIHHVLKKKKILCKQTNEKLFVVSILILIQSQSFFIYETMQILTAKVTFL